MMPEEEHRAHVLPRLALGGIDLVRLEAGVVTRTLGRLRDRTVTVRVLDPSDSESPAGTRPSSPETPQALPDPERRQEQAD